VKNFHEAMLGADAAIIATAHREFSKLLPKTFRHGVRIVIDGRNCLKKERFIGTDVIYKGIGR